MTHTLTHEPKAMNRVHNSAAIKEADGSVTLMLQRLRHGNWLELHFESEIQMINWLGREGISVPLHMIMTMKRRGEDAI